MANYANLLAQIAANIYSNNNQEITGDILQLQLNAMVASLGAGYQFMGIAHPADTPSGYADLRAYWLACEAGTYTNFGGLVLADGEVAVLKYDGNGWSKEVTGAATAFDMSFLQSIENVLPDTTLFRDGTVLDANGQYISNQYTSVWGCYKLEIPENADAIYSKIESHGDQVAMCAAFNEADVCVDVIYVEKSAESGTFIELVSAVKPNWSYLIFCCVKTDWADSRTAILSLSYPTLSKYIDVRVNDNIDAPIFYVGSTRAGDNTFTTLKGVTEYIKTNGIKNSVVYVDGEIFDLISEYGSAYLDSYVLGSRDVMPFLHVGNNTHFIFAQGAKITANYSGNNSVVSTQCSAFNVDGSCILENANIEVTNMRYCVHEDLPTSTAERPNSYTIKYINCYMDHKGNPVSGYESPVCIGGGCFRQSLSIVEGGVFKVSAAGLNAIGWHNYRTSDFGNYKSRIIVKDAYVNTGIYLGVYGDNLVEVEISGCFAPQGIRSNSQSYLDYFDLLAWGNVNS